MTTIAAMRRKVLRNIKKIVEPHFWESGYRTAIDPKKGLLAGSRALRLWAPEDNGIIRINGYVIDEIEGITEEGPITDSYCAIVTAYWNGIPLEDLIKIEKWAIKNFGVKTSS